MRIFEGRIVAHLRAMGHDEPSLTHINLTPIWTRAERGCPNWRARYDALVSLMHEALTRYVEGAAAQAIRLIGIDE